MPKDFSHENPEKVKDIVLYFSSRLRAASIATLNPDNDSKHWMLTHLVFELVRLFINCFIIFLSFHRFCSL